jgi:type I restriction enzyme M protein
MDPLGRFYTQDLFSNLLIQNIENEEPEKILELGVGRGALLKAAYNRWTEAEYFAADIDPYSMDHVSKNMPFVNLYEVNSLSNNIEQSLFLNKSTIDIAICDESQKTV